MEKLKMKPPFKIMIAIPAILILIICQSSELIKKDPSGNNILLVVRADDMASFHAANLACIKVYRSGIARSVEVMVPCAWFPEAVKLLNENPGLDVGVHLVLTSEWDHVKWRPLTNAPSLTDKDGYFYPFIWKDKNTTPGNTLLEANWKLEEIEKELRAQIDLARKYLPQVSHLSAHMGFSDMDKSVKELVRKLAKSYKLALEDDFRFNYLNTNASGKASTQENTEAFIKSIETMTPGTWVFVEHPGLEENEMKSVNNSAELNLGAERQQVTDIWTNEKVIAALQAKGVKLISYKNLIDSQNNRH